MQKHPPGNSALPGSLNHTDLLFLGDPYHLKTSPGRRPKDFNDDPIGDFQLLTVLNEQRRRYTKCSSNQCYIQSLRRNETGIFTAIYVYTPKSTDMLSTCVILYFAIEKPAGVCR